MNQKINILLLILTIITINTAQAVIEFDPFTDVIFNPSINDNETELLLTFNITTNTSEANVSLIYKFEDYGIEHLISNYTSTTGDSLITITIPKNTWVSNQYLTCKLNITDNESQEIINEWTQTTYINDVTPPEINITSPLNTTIDVPYIFVNQTWYDMSNNVTCNYTIDDFLTAYGSCDGVPIGDFLNNTSHNAYVTIIDSTGHATNSSKVYFSFNYGNQPPYFTQALTYRQLYEDETLYYDFNATDINGDNLTYTDDTNLFDINTTTGIINWTSNYSSIGNHTINISATDGELSNNITLELEVIELPIMNILIPEYASPRNTEYNFLMLINKSLINYNNYALNATIANTNVDIITIIEDNEYSIKILNINNSLNEGLYTLSGNLTINTTGRIYNFNKQLIIQDNLSNTLENVTINYNGNNLTNNKNFTIKFDARNPYITTVGGLVIANLSNISQIHYLNETLEIKEKNNLTINKLETGKYLLEIVIIDNETGQALHGTPYIKLFNITQNTKPEFTDTITSKAIDRGENFYLDFNATDIDEDALIFSTTGFFGINPINGVINWTSNSSTTNYTFTVTVSDGEKETIKTINLTINAPNNPPSFTDGITSAIINETDTLYLDFNATDIDGDSLVFSENSPLFVINPTTGIINWLSNYSSSGNYLINVSVTDGTDSITKTLNLTIRNKNQAPYFTDSITSALITEEQTLNLDFNALDIDGDSLVFSENSPLFVINPTTGVIIWTTNHSSIGTHQFNVTVSDGILNISKIITIIVNNINRAPIFSDSITSAIINESDTLHLDFNATDPDGDALSFSDDTGLFNINSSNGVINWLSNYSSAGNYTFLVRVSDGVNNTSKNITLTIINKNTVPSFTDDIQSASINEGQTLYLDYNAIDADNDSLIFSENSPLFVINPTTGIINWVATSSSAGNYVIVISVSDQLNQISKVLNLAIQNKITCGDGLCEGTETCITCAHDCTCGGDYSGATNNDTIINNATNQFSNLTTENIQANITNLNSSFNIINNLSLSFNFTNNITNMLDNLTIIMNQLTNTTGNNTLLIENARELLTNLTAMIPEVKIINETTTTGMINGNEIQNETLNIIQNGLESNITIVNGIEINETSKLIQIRDRLTNETINVTIMQREITNPSNQTLINFAIIEIIPKEYASSASEIAFREPVVIIQNDPIIAWVYNELLPGQKLNIEYELRKDVLQLSNKPETKAVESRGKIISNIIEPLTGLSILNTTSGSYGILLLSGLFGLLVYSSRKDIYPPTL